jgi:hypothetical protein
MHETARTRSPVWTILAVAGPLLWACLVLFHPMPGEGGPYEGTRDVVDRWLVVHIGQLVLTPFLVLAVWRLLDGLTTAAAAVSRCALVVWAVFFSAYDSIQGIAAGLLVRYANDRDGEEVQAVARALDYLVTDSLLAGNISFLGLVAGGAWLTTALSAALALHKARAGRAVVIATCLSTIFAVHVAPAAAGLAALTVAALLRERQRGTARASEGVGLPASYSSGAR